jgi:hypothetical protein
VKKANSIKDEQKVIQDGLQKFFDTMLQVDCSPIISPIFEMDRQDQAIPNFTRNYMISSIELFAVVKKYFSRI